MRELKDSDIFVKYINKDNKILGRASAILAGPKVEPSVVILNQTLIGDIKKRIVDKKKDNVSADIYNEVSNGRMVLFLVSPEKNLPGMMPFIVYKKAGVRMVAVNLTNLIVRNVFPDGSFEYILGDNVNAIYSVMYAAYLALDKLDPGVTLTPDALYYSAILWADMFNKPLFDVYGLNNRDRYKAFMYFAIRFFLGYFMDCPQIQIDSLSKKYVGDKNDLIIFMEDQIESKEINIYEGVVTFCLTMFNSEVNGVKGINLKERNAMNVNYYMTKFSQAYSSNALLSLCAYPYFVFALISAVTKANLIKDRSFDRIFNENKGVVNRLLVALLK